MKYLIHVYISPGRTRVSCTTAPCITWNCKNFCISLSPSSRSERLAAVVSYAHDTLMHKSTRLWWRKIYAVKSEKEIMEPCHCTKISSHLWQALLWLPFVKQRRTNSSLLETNVYSGLDYLFLLLIISKFFYLDIPGHCMLAGTMVWPASSVGKAWKK